MRTEVALSCSLKDTAFHHHCFKQTMDILACILHRKAQNNKLQYVYSQIRGRGGGWGITLYSQAIIKQLV